MKNAGLTHQAPRPFITKSKPANRFFCAMGEQANGQIRSADQGPVDRSRLEIERTLKRYGAKGFAYA
jgi:hypothetical protein